MEMTLCGASLPWGSEDLALLTSTFMVGVFKLVHP